MENTQTLNLRRFVTSAIMIGLAAVLSMIKVWEMPLGGSVTLLSMLPITLLSIKYGVKWGLFSAFIYSLVQIAIDFPKLMSWGMTLKIWIGCIVFDYLVAYTILGLAGIFRNRGKYGIYTGITLVLILRYFSHFISGTIFFDIWCPEGWNVVLYSICYNGAYMLPEIIFTLIAAFILIKLPQTKKHFLS